MKVGIITLYDNINFGNKLQNYATQVYFETMGFDVETITYWEEFHPPMDVVHLFRRTVHTFLRLVGFEEKKVSKKILNKRRSYIKSFSDEYIKIGKEVHYRKIDKDLKKAYDYFVVGSDQVWHGMHGERAELEYFLLTFADRKQRLTMSPSFGFNAIPDKYKDIFYYGLMGFESLSCREKKGASLIKGLTNQEAIVLLDPTMLVETNCWWDIIKKPDSFVKGKFIFVYLLGKLSEQLRRYLDTISKMYGYKIIDINAVNSIYYIHTRPDEFLYWISHAKLVVTDSFHAAVFAILFKRAFVVVERSDGKEMENRLDTLLDKFMFESRKLSVCYTLNQHEIYSNKWLFDIDFSHVDEILKEERVKASNFYKQCLAKKCY